MSDITKHFSKAEVSCLDERIKERRILLGELRGIANRASVGEFPDIAYENNERISKLITLVGELGSSEANFFTTSEIDLLKNFLFNIKSYNDDPSKSKTLEKLTDDELSEALDFNAIYDQYYEEISWRSERSDYGFWNNMRFTVSALPSVSNRSYNKLRERDTRVLTEKIEFLKKQGSGLLPLFTQEEIEATSLRYAIEVLKHADYSLYDIMQDIEKQNSKLFDEICSSNKKPAEMARLIIDSVGSDFLLDRYDRDNKDKFKEPSLKANDICYAVEILENNREGRSLDSFFDRRCEETGEVFYINIGNGGAIRTQIAASLSNTLLIQKSISHFMNYLDEYTTRNPYGSSSSNFDNTNFIKYLENSGFRNFTPDTLPVIHLLEVVEMAASQGVDLRPTEAVAHYMNMPSRRAQKVSELIRCILNNDKTFFENEAQLSRGRFYDELQVKHIDNEHIDRVLLESANRDEFFNPPLVSAPEEVETIESLPISNSDQVESPPQPKRSVFSRVFG